MAPRVTRQELLALVDERKGEVSSFLEWARGVEQRAIESNRPGWSLRLANRPDIGAAAKAAALFPEQWWGVVVFTAFGSTLGAVTVAPEFQRPLPPEEARAVLDRVSFARGSVGHHRIQPAVKGAKKALVAACADHELFYEVLHSDEDFETRYWRLRNARCEQWGRTTCFDLLLRAGALGLGGASTPRRSHTSTAPPAQRAGSRRSGVGRSLRRTPTGAKRSFGRGRSTGETSRIASASIGRTSLIRAATSKTPYASGRSAAPMPEAALPSLAHHELGLR